VSVVSATQRSLYPGEIPGTHVQEAGRALGPVWTGAEKLVPIGIRSPDLPARSESLYRLSYPDPQKINKEGTKEETTTAISAAFSTAPVQTTFLYGTQSVPIATSEIRMGDAGRFQCLHKHCLLLLTYTAQLAASIASIRCSRTSVRH